MNANNNSFDPTPRLKSSPIPIFFIPFKGYESNCNYCGNEYSKTLKFEQKYCKNCLFWYIKYTTDNNKYYHKYLDVHISTNNVWCIEHKGTRNNFYTTNIQEWCKYCSEISYFRQVIPNNSSFDNYLSNINDCKYDINNYYRKIDCKLCGSSGYHGNQKLMSLSLSYENYVNYEHETIETCPNCYQISSEWVESTLTRKHVLILYLPWWDNYFTRCLICLRELNYIHQKQLDCQKSCLHCSTIYSGCSYCLTTNVIFGITDQSQCMKCKRILSITIDTTNFSSENHNLDEFLFSTTISNIGSDHLIVNYINNDTNLNPLYIYKFNKKKVLDLKRQEIRWVPYSQINNLKKIAKGGFSTIYKATWSDGIKNTDVAIKKLFNSQNISYGWRGDFVT